jgi:hypothetical protein
MYFFKSVVFLKYKRDDGWWSFFYVDGSFSRWKRLQMIQRFFSKQMQKSLLANDLAIFPELP